VDKINCTPCIGPYNTPHCSLHCCIKFSCPYLMLRTMRRQYGVFISARASSRERVRWARLTGSVCRTWVRVSSPSRVASFIVTIGVTWRRNDRLASCVEMRELNEKRMFLLKEKLLSDNKIMAKFYMKFITYFMVVHSISLMFDHQSS